MSNVIRGLNVPTREERQKYSLYSSPMSGIKGIGPDAARELLRRRRAINQGIVHS